MRRGLRLLCLVLASGVCRAPARAADGITFTGAVAQAAPLTTADLKALPSRVVAVHYQTEHGARSATYLGVPLWAVLERAGLTGMPGVKDSVLHDVVLATGQDGYQAAFSGGELDPRFGGAGAPDLLAYGEGTAGTPLGADGPMRVVVPGDLAGGRYVASLAALTVLQVPQAAASSAPAGVLVFGGLVERPLSFAATDLAAMPSESRSVRYRRDGQVVEARFTGVQLWSLLQKAGLMPIPGVKNARLREYIVATGQDGYRAVFSEAELDPRFAGAAAPVLVAYAEDGRPASPDGLARLVVPGDLAGGRYVAHLARIDVLDAAAKDRTQ